MWELSTAALLCHESLFAVMGVQPGDSEPTSDDELNAKIFAQNKHRSAEDALNLFHSAHMELLNELAKLSDADLMKPFLHFQPNEKYADAKNPVINWIVDNTYGHYEKHIQWIGELRNH